MKLNWSPPVHHSFVPPSDDIGPSSYWNCNSGNTALHLLTLGGFAPLGLPGKMGVFLSSWGVHMPGDSSTFLPVSCAVGGAAGSLVGTVASSSEAAAGISGSPANGVVGFSSEVTGLLSCKGFMWSPLYLVQWPPLPGFPA